MSRTHRFHLIAAAALLGSTLAAPAIQAQSHGAGRALLNTSIVALSTRDPAVNWLLGPALEPGTQSEGEQALLGSRTSLPIRAAPSVRRAPVGGREALLGRQPEIE